MNMRPSYGRARARCRRTTTTFRSAAPCFPRSMEKIDIFSVSYFRKAVSDLLLSILPCPPRVVRFLASTTILPLICLPRDLAPDFCMASRLPTMSHAASHPPCTCCPIDLPNSSVSHHLLCRHPRSHASKTILLSDKLRRLERAFQKGRAKSATRQRLN